MRCTPTSTVPSITPSFLGFSKVMGPGVYWARMMNEKKLLTVLQGTPIWPPPVWLMRQAGRYLPEFRALREQADFITRCTTPDLASEITLQPIRRFGMDGAILFSDILMVPWALGQSLEFVDGEGPVLTPIRDCRSLEALRPGDLLEATRPIIETVRQVGATLSEQFPHTALIGFAGAPFTVACYMVDGSGTRDFSETRCMAYRAPDLFGRLIDVLIEATIVYLAAQIEAGAEAVMLFDSWAGLLPPSQFERWVVTPTQIIQSALKDRFPMVKLIGFPRLASQVADVYADITGVDCVALDTSADMVRVASKLADTVAVQGNLDPLVLVAGGPDMMEQAINIATGLRGRPHVFNLGHGVLPATSPEHVGALIEGLRAL